MASAVSRLRRGLISVLPRGRRGSLDGAAYFHGVMVHKIVRPILAGEAIPQHSTPINSWTHTLGGKKKKHSRAVSVSRLRDRFPVKVLSFLTGGK